MTDEEILNLVGKSAREAQIRDDVCSRSVLYGLRQYFHFIPEEMVTASLSLCGGAGAASGSCGAYTSSLLAVGLKYNASMEEESKNPAAMGRGVAKFFECRDRFAKEMGTTLCPEIQKQVFGRSYIFTDPKDAEEYRTVTDHAVKCADVVERAARLVAQMLLEE